jgi:hypothetical protein
MAKIVVCDKCGEQVYAGATAHSIEFSTRTTDPIDVCVDCLHALENQIYKFFFDNDAPQGLKQEAVGVQEVKINLDFDEDSVILSADEKRSTKDAEKRRQRAKSNFVYQGPDDEELIARAKKGDTSWAQKLRG